MLQGAFGLSSGLIYAPGCYASTEELISLASTSASLGGIYASHIRGEGGTLVRAVAEAIRIGREARTAVEISHHKACGKPNWGMINETLKMIEQARAEGIDVGFDVYPYTASNTSLDSILPPWARDGGKEAILDRLRNPDERSRIAETFSTRSDEFENTVMEDGWENIVVQGLSHGSNRRFENRSVADIAKELGKDPTETAFDLMVEERLNVSAIFHEISEDDVMTVMRHPLASIGSDGMSESAYGPLSDSATHPRSYGTFPRVLRRYSIEKGLFPLHEAIMKMTSIPAKRIGLFDRGILAKGMAADVVIFDPLKVRDMATFEDSHRYPEGIVSVLVNGAVTIENGQHTKERAGLVLRHTPRVG
jgi:N-acyl-D-amino-acid deacylase